MTRNILCLSILLFSTTIMQVSLASTGRIIPETELNATSESLQSGAQIIAGTCLLCHNLKYIKYRDLKKLGFSAGQISEINGDQGLSSPLTSMSSEDSLQSMFGMVPPDLSLIAKARQGGAKYVYALLTGFYTDNEGNTDNHLFPMIKMPDVLGYASTPPAQVNEIRQQAHDIAVFLDWAADPTRNERQQLGVYVISYLIFLTILFYLVKRRIWNRLGQ